MPLPQLSVVIPCYNESAIIENLVRHWTGALNSSGIHHEIIVVNDGSLDGTGRILDRLRKEIRSLRVIHQLKSGHAGAIRRACEISRGDYTLLVSADERYEPADFLRMWEASSSKVQVSAYRTHHIEPLNRRIFRALVKKIAHTWIKVEVQDPFCHFRLVRTDILQQCLSSLPRDTTSLHVSLAYLLKRDFPNQVLELPIHFGVQKRIKRRRNWTSNVTKAIATAIDLLRLRQKRITALIPAPTPIANSL